MKKGFKYYAAVWAILLVLFNVICFVTPNEVAGMTKFGGSFWVGYAFITVAFLGQLACAYMAFSAENTKKFFYRIPLISVSYTGLILTIIFGSLVMAIPGLPDWAGAIICILILGFNAIAVIKASAAADAVESVDKRIKTQTQFIKLLTVDAEGLMNRASDPAVKNACKKVYEAVRYSDPMSSDALSDVEARMRQEFSALSDAVSKGGDAAACAEALLLTIGERNAKCRLLK